MPKILLVEDNEMNRDMLSRRLDPQRLRGRHGGRTARKASTWRQPRSPTSILMDMSLPVIDGWEATRRVKADRRDQGHPGDRADRPRDGRDREKAMAAGCDDFDTKPVELPRLLGKINALLPK